MGISNSVSIKSTYVSISVLKIAAVGINLFNSTAIGISMS